MWTAAARAAYGSPVPDTDILAAVAAGEPDMAGLIAELVAAPTTLGREQGGQAVMRRP